MKFSSSSFIAATLAHALAWAAWVWLAFWPHSYQSVSVTPVQVDESGNVIGAVESEVVRHSASFAEVNGIWPLLALFIPVVLTGLALMALLTWKGRSAGRVLIIGGLALALLAFCALGYLSFGIMYLPSALALMASAFLFGFRAASRESWYVDTSS